MSSSTTRLASELWLLTDLRAVEPARLHGRHLGKLWPSPRSLKGWERL